MKVFMVVMVILALAVVGLSTAGLYWVANDMPGCHNLFVAMVCYYAMSGSCLALLPVLIRREALGLQY